jgi:hypothetical protein
MSISHSSNNAQEPPNFQSLRSTQKARTTKPIFLSRRLWRRILAGRTPQEIHEYILALQLTLESPSFVPSRMCSADMLSNTIAFLQQRITKPTVATGQPEWAGYLQ